MVFNRVVFNRYAITLLSYHILLINQVYFVRFGDLIRLVKNKISSFWLANDREIELVNKVKRGRDHYDYVELDNPKLILLLFFATVASFLLGYFSYMDYKYNIYGDVTPKPAELLEITIENPLDISIPNDYEVRSYFFRDGDSIINVLTGEFGISKNDALNSVKALEKLYNVKNIKSGQEISVKYQTIASEYEGDRVTKKVLLLEFRLLDENKLREYVVAFNEDGKYVAHRSEIPLLPYYNRYIVNINSSLYADALKAGVPAEIISTMISYYSFDIDFQRDIKRGDWFEILYESYHAESGSFTKNGEILYANLHANRSDHKIYKFNINGQSQYFDENGLSTKKSLLKTPIDGARITSNFSTKRKHPILGYTRAHKGIDFAAPVGTPFYASGNGVVEKVVTGCQVGDHSCGKGYGNYILVRHNSSYKTEYAHLSKIAKNIKVNARVKQGQVIGYVGNTGLSTGPHLHYGVIYKNDRINPNRVRSIASVRLTGNNLLRFMDGKGRIDQLRFNAVNQSNSGGSRGG